MCCLFSFFVFLFFSSCSLFSFLFLFFFSFQGFYAFSFLSFLGEFGGGGEGGDGFYKKQEAELFVSRQEKEEGVIIFGHCE